MGRGSSDMSWVSMIHFTRLKQEFETIFLGYSSGEPTTICIRSLLSTALVDNELALGVRTRRGPRPVGDPPGTTGGWAVNAGTGPRAAVPGALAAGPGVGPGGVPVVRGVKRRNPPACGWGVPGQVVRRCPTLPHPPECSTIGAVGLSFRVRYGTGRFPHAMTAVTPSTDTPAGNSGTGVVNLWVTVISLVVIHVVRFSAKKQGCCFGTV